MSDIKTAVQAIQSRVDTTLVEIKDIASATSGSVSNIDTSTAAVQSLTSDLKDRIVACSEVTLGEGAFNVIAFGSAVGTSLNVTTIGPQTPLPVTLVVPTNVGVTTGFVSGDTVFAPASLATPVPVMPSAAITPADLAVYQMRVPQSMNWDAGTTVVLASEAVANTSSTYTPPTPGNYAVAALDVT